MKSFGVRASIALIVAGVMVFGGVATSASAAPRDDVVTLTNQQRYSAGLPALTRDATLDAVAQEWAQNMSNAGQMVHSTNEWRAARIPAGWYTNGENIAYGYSSASAVMNAWMNSQGHKENILRSNFTHIGVGYVASGNYWVQIFGGYDKAKAPKRPPFGFLDAVSIEAATASASLALSGWAIDPMSPSSSLPLTIQVTDPYGTQSSFAVTANERRDDVAAAYSDVGPNHGYLFRVPIGGASGAFKACVTSTDQSVVTNLGCRSASLGPSRPIGWLDSAAIEIVDGTPVTSVKGWVLDDGLRAAASKVRVSVTDPSNRTVVSVVDASVRRDDVAAAFPGAGPSRGFSVQSPVGAIGVYKVCVASIGAPLFGSPSAPMTCQNLNWASKPIGWIDSVGVSLVNGSPRLNVAGWALDDGLRSSASKVKIAVTDPAGRTSSSVIDASSARPDVAAAFPGATAERGFSFSSAVGTLGTYHVCISSVGAAAFGSPTVLMTCQDVQLASKPVGWVDKVASASGGIDVAGWVVDDTLRGSPVQAKVTVTSPNGQVASRTLSTTETRADVRAAFPGVGGSQGFAATIAAPLPGAYRVCFEAVGDPQWGMQTTRLECRAIQR